MAILVTGGAGYIGSHTVVELLKKGNRVTILDNFSNSKPLVLDRIEELTGTRPELAACDLLDEEGVARVFEEHHFDAVIHFAGLKAVGESTRVPLRYYHNNLTGTLLLLGQMSRHGVTRLVFSSSATVYGDPQTVPIPEEAPLSTTNPYGSTKLMIERILGDLAASEKGRWHIALLRYFNPIGAHPSGRIGEDPNGIPNNLVPYVTQVAVGKLPRVNVFGDDYPTPDGTGVRDYIHVVDLARGHLCALEHIDEIDGAEPFNLGTGRGSSVLEVIHAVEKAVGKPIAYAIAPRRPGDVAACYADASKARARLGWQAEYSLEDMCASAWNWQKNNPNGYEE